MSKQINIGVVGVGHLGVHHASHLPVGDLGLPNSLCIMDDFQIGLDQFP